MYDLSLSISLSLFTYIYIYIYICILYNTSCYGGLECNSHTMFLSNNRIATIAIDIIATIAINRIATITINMIVIITIYRFLFVRNQFRQVPDIPVSLIDFPDRVPDRFP